MKLELTGETAKFVASALVVASAFLIMAPGLLQYVASLWRLAVWVVTAVLMAFLLSFVLGKVRMHKRAAGESNAGNAVSPGVVGDSKADVYVESAAEVHLVEPGVSGEAV